MSSLVTTINVRFPDKLTPKGKPKKILLSLFLLKKPDSRGYPIFERIDVIPEKSAALGIKGYIDNNALVIGSYQCSAKKTGNKYIYEDKTFQTKLLYINLQYFVDGAKNNLTSRNLQIGEATICGPEQPKLIKTFEKAIIDYQVFRLNRNKPNNLNNAVIDFSIDLPQNSL